jgi:CubicO group peptidase (beta-lactamase class C family)
MTDKQLPYCPLSLLLLMVLLPGGHADAKEFSKRSIDSTAERVMAHYSVPGMAVGLIMDGKVVHASGYGVLEAGKRERVDQRSLFKIASNSKAITTAALALLVDDGLLDWNDKVIDHLPEFQLYDPWVTREFTVVDLLTHRSGLAPFAGDMMLWPEPNAFSRADIVHNLRYLQPVSGFRSEYAYDNLLYVVAGELLAAVAGQSWESFVDERIFSAMGAGRCFAGEIPVGEMNNLAAPHGDFEGRVQIIERSRISAMPNTSAAAGGIRCSLEDMLKWASVQLYEGKLPNDEPLFSSEQHEILWRPQILLSVTDDARERDQTHFRAYALGWRLADVHGYLEVSHTGTLSGWNSYMVLIPELELGAVVLTNGSSGDARRAMMYSLVRPWLDEQQVDWIAVIDEERAREEQENATQDAPNLCAACKTGNVLAPLADYTGTFRDPWFGDVIVSQDQDGLQITAQKSPRLTGRLEPYLGNTFIARWTDRTLEGDAWVTFTGDTPNSIERMAMRAISKRSDYDFHDLKLKRVQQP